MKVTERCCDPDRDIVNERDTSSERVRVDVIVTVTVPVGDALWLELLEGDSVNVKVKEFVTESEAETCDENDCVL